MKDPLVRKDARRKRRLSGKDATGNPSLDLRIQQSEARGSMCSADFVDNNEPISENMRTVLGSLDAHLSVHREIHAPVTLDAATRAALTRVVGMRSGRLHIESLPSHAAARLCNATF